MDVKQHLMAACCPPAELEQHAATIEALDPNVRATLLALLKQFGAKALPIILQELPVILAGNYAQAIAAIIAALVVPQPSPV